VRNKVTSLLRATDHLPVGTGAYDVTVPYCPVLCRRGGKERLKCVVDCVIYCATHVQRHVTRHIYLRQDRTGAQDTLCPPCQSPAPTRMRSKHRHLSGSPSPRGQHSWARCRSIPTCFLEHFRGTCMSVDTVSSGSHPPDRRVLKDFVTLHALPCNVGRLERPRRTPQSSQGPARVSPRQVQVAAV